MAMRFPSECLEDIFRHMSVRNLLKCTRVCPEWNDFIGSTRSCMEKIKVMIWYTSYSHNREQSVKRVLTSSQRRYERWHVGGTRFEEIQKYVSEKGRKWKHFTADCITYTTYHHFLDLLKVFDASTQNLVLSLVKVEEAFNSSIEYPDLHFPNLKSLDIYGVSLSYIDKAFINCKNLESLSVSSIQDFLPSTADVLRTILKANSGMKVLKIKTGSVLSSNLSSEVSFKLREFSIKKVENEFQQRNLKSFLKTQANTLEVVRLPQALLFVEEVMTIVLAMPRLRQLDTKKLHYNQAELAGISYKTFVWRTVLIKPFPKTIR